MTTGATEHIDITTAAVFVPTVWSKRAIVAREKQLVTAKLVNRVFEADVDAYGNTVHVPSVGNLSVQSKNMSANAATVFETITETNTDITIATWEYSAIALETATKRQINRDLLKTYAPKQGYALAKSVDSALTGLASSITANVGTLKVPLTYADVLSARQKLDDVDVPSEDRYILISPAQEAGFLQLDQFIHRDYSVLHGSVDDEAASMDMNLNLDKAYIGSWLGMPCYKSTNVNGSNAAGHDMMMWQLEAIALVLQLKATTHLMFDINYLAEKVVVEQLYGDAIMRNDHGVDVKGL